MPELVNQERRKAGLPELAVNPLLDRSAAAKCADAQAKQYWGHDGPDGTTWYSFIRAQVQYRRAGENLAYGYQSAAAVVAGWMDSPGHRANILNPAFSEVGHAVCTSEAYPDYVAQHFIGR